MKRFFKWLSGFLAVIFAIVIVLVIIGALTGPKVPDDSVLRVVFRGELAESPQEGLGDIIGGAPTINIHELTAAIRRAADDQRILGLVLELREPAVNLAQIEEIEDAMATFRASGKWNVAFLETAGEFNRGDGAYALAATAEQIVLSPPGDINLVGLQSEVPFLKGTFEKLKVTPYVQKRHEYKSAADTFTQTSFSQPNLESLKAVVDDLQSNIIAHLAKRRGKDEEIVRQWLATGPHGPATALEQGMVDALNYWDDILGKAQSTAKRDEPFVGLGTYIAAFQPTSAKHHLGVIFGDGAVTRNRPEGLFDANVMAAESLTAAFRRARQDKVQGVLFRVDSPGGSYVASDLIRREVQLTREAGIPVVVSMGNVAASGGYFVSMDANRIFAQPSTITGSIGVFAALLATRRFFSDFLGVTWDSYAASPNAAAFSFLDPPSEAIDAKFTESLDRIYEDFITKVANARQQTVPAIDAIARGRIWSGKAAVQNGLVDELGGLRQALDHLKGLAEIPQDVAVQLNIYPRPRSFFEQLSEAFSRNTTLQSRIAAAIQQGHRALTGSQGALYDPLHRAIKLH